MAAGPGVGGRSLPHVRPEKAQARQDGAVTAFTVEAGPQCRRHCGPALRDGGSHGVRPGSAGMAWPAGGRASACLAALLRHGSEKAIGMRQKYFSEKV